MIIFKYRCINLEIDNENQVAGFLVELGDQWDDLMIYEVNRKEEVLHKNSKSMMLDKDWLSKFLTFIDNQKEIKKLSSWIYKLGDKATEHKITIEGTGWNKEIGIYNLGELVNYEFQSYKVEEKVLIEFIDKVIELFKEQNIDLSYNSIRVE